MSVMSFKSLALAFLATTAIALPAAVSSSSNTDLVAVPMDMDKVPATMLPSLADALRMDIQYSNKPPPGLRRNNATTTGSGSTTGTTASSAGSANGNGCSCGNNGTNSANNGTTGTTGTTNGTAGTNNGNNGNNNGNNGINTRTNGTTTTNGTTSTNNGGGNRNNPSLMSFVKRDLLSKRWMTCDHDPTYVAGATVFIYYSENFCDKLFPEARMSYPLMAEYTNLVVQLRDIQGWNDIGFAINRLVPAYNMTRAECIAGFRTIIDYNVNAPECQGYTGRADGDGMGNFFGGGTGSDMGNSPEFYMWVERRFNAS